MAHIVKDWVRETTTTEGTGNIVLGGAPLNFDTFANAVGNGNTCWYCIRHQTAAEREIGLGTMTAGELVRTSVYKSSNSNNAVNFSEGTKDVFVVVPADRFLVPDAAGTTIAFAGTLGVSNAAGGALLDEAASATNPTIVPDKTDPDTGIGHQGADVGSLIAGGTEVVRFQAANATVFGDFTVSGASNPLMRVTDTTTPCVVQLQALDTGVRIGSETNHDASLVAGNIEVARLVYAAGADRYATITGGVSGSGGLATFGSSGGNLAIKPGGTVSAEFGGVSVSGRGHIFTGSDVGDPTYGVGAGRLDFTCVIAPKSYTVATLPTATARGLIYVSDETGGATLAFADGTNWRRVQDRAIVS